MSSTGQHGEMSACFELANVLTHYNTMVSVLLPGSTRCAQIVTTITGSATNLDSLAHAVSHDPVSGPQPAHYGRSCKSKV